MTDTSNQLPVPQRMPSGIAGLDRILQGGFLKGGSYLITGPPGAGKTILGNQLCFNHVAAGGRAIYLTLLAETNSRMLAHIQTFTFFTLTPIADTLSYLSGYSILEQEGLEGLTALLRSEIRSHRATLLLIDGTVTAEQAAPSAQEWKKFLYDLNVAAEILGCTIFLIMQFKEGLASQPEQTMVDGLIELKIRAEDMRSFRELQVRKFRGSAFLEGGHNFAITQEGLVVHPRAEAVLAVSPAELPKPLATMEQPRRMGVGVTHLDEMLRGGLPSSSTTLLLGASGTGKTLLGCHFLTKGAAQGQKALYFGFNETPAQLTRKMERFSLDASRFVAAGQLELLWQPPVQDFLDVLAERLLNAIQRLEVKCLFIDGLGGFQRTVASAERLDLFLTALFTALRTLDVTTVCSVELPDLFSPTVTLPQTLSGTTAMVENILLLRYVELHSHFYRLISIMKMRESGYDPAIREFRITDHGIEVASTFASAEAILTGIARSSTAAPGAPGVPPAFGTSEARSQGHQP